MLILKNKPIINVFSKQYPVGQGGLHLSVIECFSPDNYRLLTRQAYIYDCGDSGNASTSSTIRWQIDNLFNDVHPFDKPHFFYRLESLDKLYIFISHLHQDHYNGLIHLKNYIQQNLVFRIKPRLMLPYMTETEMDILIGAYDENNELSKSDYEKFIRNPEEFFENVFEVIYIADNDNFNKNYAGQKFPNYYNCNNDINISFDNNNRKIINHNQEIRIGNSEYYWVLRAFCNPICLKSLNFIRNNVNSNFDDISITVNRRNKKIYQQEIKDHNLSSMCLYSGPCHNIKGEGLMHTGDAKLLRDDVYNNFRIHYHNYLENICIAQIPHHGSKRDSNFDTFSIFPNLKLLYATKQEKTNGKTYPHLSPDYIGKDFIKEVTEKPKTVLAFENIDALDHIFYIDKTIFEKLSFEENY